MHPLLVEQLRKAFGSPDAAPAGVASLLQLVDAAYQAADRERASRRASIEARFDAFMDNTPLIVALKDPNGILLYANKTCARHFPHLSLLGGGASFAWLPPEIAGTREDDAAVIKAGQAIESLQSVPVQGGEERHWLVYRFPVPDEQGRTLVGVSALDVTERSRTEDALRRQALILEMIHDAVIVTDLHGRITNCNEAAGKLSGYSREEILGQSPRLWQRESDGSPALQDILEAVMREGRWSGDIPFARKDGSEGVCESVVVPLRAGERVMGFIAVNRDMTEKRSMARQLLQSQKLEAIGELAAGIAHEINTPTQYVTDNMHFLEDSFRDLFELISRHQELLAAAAKHPDLADPVERVNEAARAADMDYLGAEVPVAIRQSLDGLQRISEIVRGVKAFAHPGGGSKSGVDLNAALENVITVSRNEWKYVAEIETDFDSTLPPVSCFAGEINQVFLNIIVNAAHAIGDVVRGESGARGRITVSTRLDGDWVEVRIADSGPGIPEHVQSRIFDPFFTTKPVGKGTGQGLTISHRVVVERHGGTLSFESALGKGTTFIVRLPLGAVETQGSEPKPAESPNPPPAIEPESSASLAEESVGVDHGPHRDDGRDFSPWDEGVGVDEDRPSEPVAGESDSIPSPGEVSSVQAENGASSPGPRFGKRIDFLGRPIADDDGSSERAA